MVNPFCSRSPIVIGDVLAGGQISDEKGAITCRKFTCSQISRYTTYVNRRQDNWRVRFFFSRCLVFTERAQVMQNTVFFS